MRTIIALKVIVCIEILEQFNKTDIYLVFYTILVEQESRLQNECNKFAACTYAAVQKEVFFSAFK